MVSARVYSYTTTRPDLMPLIPTGAQRVLDVGCSNGALGEEVKRHLGAHVVGIELEPGFAREAAGKLDRVLCDDALQALPKLRGERFDCVICADVLEHLVDPGAVLHAIRPLLSSSGRVVVSLPNVRFYDTFVQLGLKGRWPERDRGVHDRTHVRWFADANARQLFAGSGFRVLHAGANYRLHDRPDARVNRFAPLVAWGVLRPFLTYQLLYVLAPATGGERRAGNAQRTRRR